MGIYLRDGRWMVYYRDENGKRRDRSFGRGETAKQDASAFDQAVKEGRVWNGELNAETSDSKTPTIETVNVEAPYTGREPSGVTFAELARKYLEHLKASGRTDEHIRTLAHLLAKSFTNVIDKNKPVDSMTYIDDMLPFISHYQTTKARHKGMRSQATINRYCDYIASIFNFGIENELTKVNPMSKRKKSKEQPRNIQLTVNDLQNIIHHAEDHVKWAMEVCFHLGTRPGKSELLSLKWENIDFEKGLVQIYATKTKTFRTVPVKASFVDKLKTMKEKARTEYVIEYKGKRVDSVRKSFNTACELAGIKYPVRMYDIRHLFATTLLSNNADLAAVSKLMGHATVKMTADTYYHYLEGEKERAVNLLPELAV